MTDTTDRPSSTPELLDSPSSLLTREESWRSHRRVDEWARDRG